MLPVGGGFVVLQVTREDTGRLRLKGRKLAWYQKHSDSRKEVLR